MKNKKFICRQAAALMLSAAMVSTYVLPAAAEVPETRKEENIYANLSKDGEVEEIYVVNGYELSRKTDIIDYGDYTAVRNLTSSSEISNQDGRIETTADQGKFYYQGNLAHNDLPWLIGIDYELNGKKISADVLAGKSGALKITIMTAQNRNVEQDFFDNYLLQATVTLNTDMCTNIEAEGATLANVGNKKQIVYNIMAGQEKTVEITAQVKDFEMDAISFSGVPMSFDVNADNFDTSELTNKTSDITGAVRDLDEGADTLVNGTENLMNGAEQYAAGIDLLQGGTAALTAGVRELDQHSAPLNTGVMMLTEGTYSLLDGTEDLDNGISAYTSGTSEASAGADILAEKTKDLPGLMSTLSDALGKLQQAGEQLADADSGAVAQINAALDQISAGLTGMESGLTAMDSSLSAMAGGLEELEPNLLRLINGLDGMDAGYLAGLEQIYAGYGQQVAALENIMDLLPGMDSETAVYEGEPEMTTNTETMEGEYTEDHTESTTEETVDEEGNKVTVINNTVYMTKTDTTTITNDTKTTQTVSGDVSGLNELSAALYSLHQNMSGTRDAMCRILYGDGTVENPGLNASVAELRNGTEQIYGALYTGNDRIPGLKPGLQQLQIGISGEGGMLSGVKELQTGVDLLKTSLNEDTPEHISINSALKGISEGLTELQDETAGLPGIGAQLTSGIGDLHFGLSKLTAQNSTLRNGAKSLNGGAVTISDGAEDLFTGIASYTNGTAQISVNMNDVESGISELQSKMTGITDGMNQLKDGVLEMKGGTQEFKDETSDIDTQIMEGIEKELENMTGGNYRPVSFVSGKNVNVDSVQFIMKTENIRVLEKETAENNVEKKSIWDKIKRLFC